MNKIARTILFISMAASVFAASAMGMDQQGIASLLARGCGPENIKFSVSIGDPQSPLSEFKSTMSRLIVLPEAVSSAEGCRYTVTRIGMDGQWLGATCVGGYLVADIAPGPHHLCANFQKLPLPQLTALRAFSFEPGRTYYFRATIIERSYEGNRSLHLKLTDEDEGQLLMSLRRQSQSRVR